MGTTRNNCLPALPAVSVTPPTALPAVFVTPPRVSVLIASVSLKYMGERSGKANCWLTKQHVCKSEGTHFYRMRTRHGARCASVSLKRSCSPPTLSIFEEWVFAAVTRLAGRTRLNRCTPTEFGSCEGCLRR